MYGTNRPSPWTFNRVLSTGLAVTLLCAAEGFAADLYVDDNDPMCGTRAPCYPAVQDAVEAAVPGDRVLVLPGVYAENIQIEAKQLTLMAESGPSVTVLDGGSNASVILIGEGADVTIDGFTIQNAGGPTAFVENGYGIVFTPFVSARASIRNNLLTRNMVRGGIGIIGGTTVDVDVQGNRLIENFRGIDVEFSTALPLVTGSVRITNNIVAFNRVDPGDPSGSGISLIACCAFGDPGDFALDVLNNTVFGNEAVFGGGLAANASNLRLLNNIFFMNTATEQGADLYLVQAALTALVVSNIIGDGQFPLNNSSLDPELVDPASRDFHLQSNSPAIDAGVDDPFLPQSDFEGDHRTVDGDGDGVAIVDIGADEFSPNMPPDCSGATSDPERLWPPNHKFRSVSVVGVTDPDGDPVAVTIDAIFQDEAVGAVGDRRCPDADGHGTGIASLRAERSSRGDGRVYHLEFSANDGRGGECTGTVRVCTPHHGSSCKDDGPIFDSSQCALAPRSRHPVQVP